MKKKNVLLKRYADNDAQYQLARYIFIILIFLLILFIYLSFIEFKSQLMNTIMYIPMFLVIVSLLLVFFGQVKIAVPILLISMNMFTSITIFLLEKFVLYEIYMITTFQLTILFISTLITFKRFYAFLMAVIGIVTIVLHLFVRGLPMAREIVLSNSEDYIISVALIALSGFLLTRIIRQKMLLTKDLIKELENSKKAHQELKVLQESLIQSEKMRSIGSLAAGMSHEINNPLGGMVQGAQAVSNRLRLRNEANQKAADSVGIDLEALQLFLRKRHIYKQLDHILESGRKASDIVNSILSYARIEGSRSSYDITDVIEKAILLAGSDYELINAFSFDKTTINRYYDENLPLVPCDSGKIQQALFNIIKNGVIAMKECANPQFDLTINKGNNCVTVIIENNGPTIKDEDIKHIFEPFYSTKPEGEGKGLGLAVAYFIITETHGGSLKAESGSEVGIKFILELPL